MSARSVHSMPELVMAWGRGRAVSRLTPPPVGVPGGFRAFVDAPTRRIRHVLHTYSPEFLGRLAAEQTAPGSQIRLSGPTAALRAALPPDWVSDDAGHLMTASLTPHRAEVPEGYRVEVTTEGELTVATVRDANGEAAASARLGRSGEFGVFDQVQTSPAHRRRRLGTAVMRALSNRALELGMTVGLLVGTDTGRALYETLGWTFRSDFPGAFRKGDGQEVA
ncbi:GNAT family N-acetyltransferase [Glycomyces arizonensis]|uniref:GNAT family N-acetyltransferase n=1 Tax=Glycomyces arizonensis TaxID=256035 RepID=UPI000416D2D3|nr:GNAT family N-acetyltransferase [Glycomyces arizonensis]